MRILFSETAIFIGLLQLLLPLMILSLVGALENLPRDAIAAARMLGANGFQIFWKITLPLTREGFAIGGTLVFAGSMTAYITPAVLGGSKVLMLETLLYQRVSVANDLVSAAVIAFDPDRDELLRQPRHAPHRQGEGRAEPVRLGFALALALVLVS